MRPHILVVEDEQHLGVGIKYNLEAENYRVTLVEDGPTALRLVDASAEPIDLIVLDLMLPKIDGLTVLQTLREEGNDTHVLVLTAKDTVDERVTGLRRGADDYLVKPFAFSELLARINALARRPPMGNVETVLLVADLKMDLIKRAVTRSGQAVDLQPREFRLLEYLMRHAGEVVTRTMLLEHVWDFHFDPHTNVVETHISRVRAKVDKPFEQSLIRTVRGAGYVLKALD